MPAVKRIASSVGVAAALFAGLGTVAALWENPLFMRLPALNMMPMTMSYAVKDKNQLANLQPMQEVEFRGTYDGKDYLITDIK